MGNSIVSPDVTTHGPGEPEVVVIGGVHGDETGGVRAVCHLREADLDLQRGVAFVLANPAAIDAGKRYLDSDLNRAFPGDPAGDREAQLAARICALIENRPTLSLHGTNARPTPFALVYRSEPREFELAAQLPVPQVVDHWGINEQTITTCGFTIEIEVGPQGSEDAAVAAERQAHAFLCATDALPGEPPDMTPEFYHMAESVPKPPGSNYELHVENFDPVSRGTVYATVDSHDLVADEPFYPILMSEDGYSDIFGYRGSKLAESLDGVREIWLDADRGSEDPSE